MGEETRAPLRPSLVAVRSLLHPPILQLDLRSH